MEDGGDGGAPSELQEPQTPDDAEEEKEEEEEAAEGQKDGAPISDEAAQLGAKEEPPTSTSVGEAARAPEVAPIASSAPAADAGDEQPCAPEREGSSDVGGAGLGPRAQEGVGAAAADSAPTTQDDGSDVAEGACTPKDDGGDSGDDGARTPAEGSDGEGGEEDAEKDDDGEMGEDHDEQPSEEDTARTPEDEEPSDDEMRPRAHSAGAEGIVVAPALTHVEGAEVARVKDELVAELPKEDDVSEAVEAEDDLAPVPPKEGEQNEDQVEGNFGPELPKDEEGQAAPQEHDFGPELPREEEKEEEEKQEEKQDQDEEIEGASQGEKRAADDEPDKATKKNKKAKKDKADDKQEPDEPKGASIACVRLDEVDQLRRVIKEQGHDFWLSCLAEGAHVSLIKTLETMKCDGVPAAESFTHCYVAPCEDIKVTANELLDELGLGLRRKRVHSNPGPGYVFALVNLESFSLLCKKNMALAATDKRLSTEERLRRSALRFEEVSLEGLMKKATEYQLSFWLTTFSEVDIKEARKRVVCAKMDKVYASDRFSKCFLHGTRNLLKSCQKLVNTCGMGLRKNKIHSSKRPGVMVLLITEKEHREDAKMKQMSVIKGGERTKRKKKKHKDEKRIGKAEVGIDDLAAPAPTASTEDLALHGLGLGPDASMLDHLEESAATLAVRSPTGEDRAEDDMTSEERLKHRQLQVLEKRTQMLLPELISKRQVTTEFVQSRLEELMNKPHGRLERFRDEIDQIWRRVLATDLHRRQWRVLERKLEAILPTFPKDSLATEYIQARLEEAMQRPAGKFDKFRADIDLYWRATLKAEEMSLRQPLREALLASTQQQPAEGADGAADGGNDDDDDDDDVTVVGFSGRPPPMPLPGRMVPGTAGGASEAWDLISDDEAEATAAAAAAGGAGAGGGGDGDDSDLEVLDAIIAPASVASAALARAGLYRFRGKGAGSGLAAPSSVGGLMVGGMSLLQELAAQAAEAASAASAAAACADGRFSAAPAEGGEGGGRGRQRAFGRGRGTQTAAGARAADAAEEVEEALDSEEEEQGLAVQWVEEDSATEDDDEADAHSGEEDDEAEPKEDGDEGSDMEVDEFGLGMALDRLAGDASEDEAVAALELLLRSSPTPELLEGCSWQGPLEDFATGRGTRSRAGTLARRLLSGWKRRLAKLLAAEAPQVDDDDDDNGGDAPSAADDDADAAGAPGAWAADITQAPALVDDWPPANKRRRVRGAAPGASGGGGGGGGPSTTGQAQLSLDAAYAALAEMEATAARKAAMAHGACGVAAGGTIPYRGSPIQAVLIDDD